MACRKRPNLSERSTRDRRPDRERRQNKTVFCSVLGWLMPEDTLFTEDRFHGNINWTPEELARQAVIWAWQDTKNVTDAFAVTAEICEDLGMHKVAKTYTTFMDALDRYRSVFGLRLGERCQRLAAFREISQKRLAFAHPHCLHGFHRATDCLEKLTAQYILVTPLLMGDQDISLR